TFKEDGLGYPDQFRMLSYEGHGARRWILKGLLTVPRMPRRLDNRAKNGDAALSRRSFAGLEFLGGARSNSATARWPSESPRHQITLKGSRYMEVTHTHPAGSI